VKRECKICGKRDWFWRLSLKSYAGIEAVRKGFDDTEKTMWWHIPIFTHACNRDSGATVNPRGKRCEDILAMVDSCSLIQGVFWPDFCNFTPWKNEMVWVHEECWNSYVEKTKTMLKGIALQWKRLSDEAEKKEEAAYSEMRRQDMECRRECERQAEERINALSHEELLRELARRLIRAKVIGDT